MKTQRSNFCRPFFSASWAAAPRSFARTTSARRALVVVDLVGGSVVVGEAVDPVPVDVLVGGSVLAAEDGGGEWI